MYIIDVPMVAKGMVVKDLEGLKFVTAVTKNVGIETVVGVE